MNKKERMNDRIRNHGIKLIEYFGLPFDTDPTELCKKLFRIENKGHRIAEAMCNGTISEEQEEKEEKALERAFLRATGRDIDKTECFFNWDPRGHFLKMENPPEGFYKDWGGYGIIAPDFREE